MLEKQSPTQFRESYLNEDIAAQDGLVCGGTMYFYLEPRWQSEAFLPIAQEIMQAYQGGQHLTVATVVSDPESEKNVGKKLIIRNDGSVSGSLEPKELQNLVIKAGKKIAATGDTEYIEGESGIQIYVEGFTSPPTLVIMGGGHVGKAVYHLALTLGFRIIIVDDRPEFSNKERFPEAEKTIVADFDKALNGTNLNINTYILVATRGHRCDDMATRSAVETPARYVGLLGSKRKNLMIFRDLLKSGVSIEKVKEIHAPVGLNIGALTPEELAVSIMAEIIMCMRGGDGSPMKMENSKLLELIERLPVPDKTPLPF